MPKLKKAGERGISLGLRFSLFLAVLVSTIILVVAAVLLSSGTFTAGLRQSEDAVKSELTLAARDIAEQYGHIAWQAISLARNLSQSIAEKADSINLSTSNLDEHPELLEEIIGGEYDKLLFALQVAKSSGAFFILEATVNPSHAQAVNSRAGLYLKNMEPNVVSSSTPNITVLRGSPAIARRRSHALHAQWRLEFDVSDAPYYHRLLAAADANPGLSLSRLYYWSEPLLLPGTSEEVMLCTVPLIDARGNVFGVCGLEISAMLFKLSHLPGSSTYQRLFFLLAPLREEGIPLQESLVAGGYAARVAAEKGGVLVISPTRQQFYLYRQGESHSYLGMHTVLPLYPADAVFAEEQWMVAAMVPQEDIMGPITRLNLLLFSSLVVLAIGGILLSLLLGRKLFLKPIAESLAIIKSSDYSTAPKTKIPEFDNLIDYLALHNRELSEKAREENISFQALDQFLEKTKELSPAEYSVFSLYCQGYTAQEIAQKLYRSINTIKTHSKRIYMKLDLKTREELLLYVQLLKETGREIP